MTSPRVVELPRRLEPVSPDTFLDGGEVVFRTPRADTFLRAARDSGSIALTPRAEAAQLEASTSVKVPAAALDGALAQAAA